MSILSFIISMGRLGFGDWGNTFISVLVLVTLVSNIVP